MSNNKKNIVIETVKVVTGNGIQERKITRLSAAKKEQCPKEYLNGKHCFFLGKNAHNECAFVGKYYNDSLIRFLSEGDIIPEKNFQDVLSYVRECGNELTRINKEIRALRKEWHGKETFTI